MVAPWLGTRVVQQRNQTPTYKRITPQMFESANVCVPEFHEARRFRPQAQHLVVIIRQRDAPASANSADHLPDHLFGLPHVFEQEAGMNHVEPAPFGLFER